MASTSQATPKLLKQIESNSTDIELFDLNIAGIEDKDTDEVILKLAKSLETNTNLKTIILDGKKIGDNAIEALMLALHKNNSLTKLSLKSCDISATGGQFIVDMLAKNHGLKELIVEENNFYNLDPSQPIKYPSDQIYGIDTIKFIQAIYSNSNTTLKKTGHKDIDQATADLDDIINNFKLLALTNPRRRNTWANSEDGKNSRKIFMHNFNFKNKYQTIKQYDQLLNILDNIFAQESAKVVISQSAYQSSQQECLKDESQNPYSKTIQFGNSSPHSPNQLTQPSSPISVFYECGYLTLSNDKDYDSTPPPPSSRNAIKITSKK